VIASFRDDAHDLLWGPRYSSALRQAGLERCGRSGSRATPLNARSAISRGAIEDPDEATFCLDCGHFVRRDRRLGTLVGSSAVDE